MRCKKILLTLVFCCCWLTIAGDAITTTGNLSSFTAIKNTEPDFAEIMAVYAALNGLDDLELRGWEGKIKRSAFFPTLYAGYDHQIKKGESLKVADNVSISSGIVTVGPEDNDYDFDNDFGRAIRVRAVWALDEAVFNRNLFTLENARRDRVETAHRHAEQIFKIYETRQLYLAQYLAERGSDSQHSRLSYARFLLLTDRLNQLTANTFRDRFWRE